MTLTISIISKLNQNYAKCSTCDETVPMLRKTIEDMTLVKKEDDFVILHYKAQIRLLRDSLKKFKKASAKALYDESSMLENLEYKMEQGLHLEHNGKAVLYPGEETMEQYNKRKCMSSGNSSSSDSSS